MTLDSKVQIVSSMCVPRTVPTTVDVTQGQILWRTMELLKVVIVTKVMAVMTAANHSLVKTLVTTVFALMESVPVTLVGKEQTVQHLCVILPTVMDMVSVMEMHLVNHNANVHTLTLVSTVLSYSARTIVHCVDTASTTSAIVTEGLLEIVASSKWLMCASMTALDTAAAMYLPTLLRGLISKMMVATVMKDGLVKTAVNNRTVLTTVISMVTASTERVLATRDGKGLLVMSVSVTHLTATDMVPVPVMTLWRLTASVTTLTWVSNARMFLAVPTVLIMVHVQILNAIVNLVSLELSARKQFVLTDALVMGCVT